MVARTRAKKESSKQNRKSRKAPSRKQLESRSCPADSNMVALRELQDWLLPKVEVFAGLGLHGNISWSATALVPLVLCWAWSESKNLTDAFDEAKRQCTKLGINTLTTCQGFMGALVTWTDPLMLLLWPVLHQRMQEIGGKFWRIDGWVPIAFDGSRSSAPRTESNEKALCAPNYGKGQTAKYRKKKTKGMRRRKNKKNKTQPQEPQVWITKMWHMGLRLPFMWRLGPSNSSERNHVKEMLNEGDFPENTLFCGDAGFVGYPLWSHLDDHGHDFLVRVGANVSLLSQWANYRTISDSRVWCRPQDAMRSGRPALKLRLVKVKIGKTKMWADERTEVVSSDERSDRQFLQNALGHRSGIPRPQTNAGSREAA